MTDYHAHRMGRAPSRGPGAPGGRAGSRTTPSDVPRSVRATENLVTSLRSREPEVLVADRAAELLVRVTRRLGRLPVDPTDLREADARGLVIGEREARAFWKLTWQAEQRFGSGAEHVRAVRNQRTAARQAASSSSPSRRLKSIIARARRSHEVEEGRRSGGYVQVPGPGRKA